MRKRGTGRVLVVGSLNADLVTRVPRLPSVGETVMGTSFDVVAGGKGANQAVAAARAGASVKMVGCVGDDAFGDLLRRELEDAGVDAREVGRAQGLATGTAQILVDAAGRNQIAVAPGANARVQPPSAIDADVVVLQLEVADEVNAAVIASAAQSGTPVILNAAPARELVAEVRASVAWLVVNESEATSLAKVAVNSVEDARRAAAVLRRLTPGVVITLGAAGALLASKADLLHQPSPQVEVVDTVAAGDAFVGVFAAALARGEDEAEALALAVAAGSSACTRRGAIPSLPDSTAIAALRRALPPTQRFSP